MNRKIIHQIKEWGLLIFWVSFIIAFLYLIITVKGICTNSLNKL